MIEESTGKDKDYE